jgi:hypothetical protein
MQRIPPLPGCAGVAPARSASLHCLGAQASRPQQHRPAPLGAQASRPHAALRPRRTSCSPGSVSVAPARSASLQCLGARASRLQAALRPSRERGHLALDYMGRSPPARAIPDMTSQQKRTAETPRAQKSQKRSMMDAWRRRSVCVRDARENLPLRTLRHCGDLPFLQWTQT